MAEVTAFRNNALPYPVYGVPWTLILPILDADGDGVTDGTIDSLVSINGDTTAAGATPVEIGTDCNYYFTLTAAQMTADIVSGSIGSTTAGAKRTAFVLYPRKLVSLRTGTCQGGDVTYITLDANAGAPDDLWNGCLCVATIDTLIEARVISDYTGSNQRGAVTPSWNVAPDNNDTFIIYLPEGRQASDVKQWLGTAPTTPNVAGVPKVDVTHLLGTAWTAPATAGRPDVNVMYWYNYAVPAPSVSGIPPVDVTYVHGSALDESGAGYLAAGIKKFFDVATPTSTMNVITWNTAWDAEVESEANDALVELNLDHLLKVATAKPDMTTEVVDNSVLSRIIAAGDTSVFDPPVNSLQFASLRAGGLAYREDQKEAKQDQVGASIIKAVEDLGKKIDKQIVTQMDEHKATRTVVASVVKPPTAEQIVAEITTEHGEGPWSVGEVVTAIERTKEAMLEAIREATLPREAGLFDDE